MQKLCKIKFKKIHHTKKLTPANQDILIKHTYFYQVLRLVSMPVSASGLAMGNHREIAKVEKQENKMSVEPQGVGKRRKHWRTAAWSSGRRLWVLCPPTAHTLLWAKTQLSPNAANRKWHLWHPKVSLTLIKPSQSCTVILFTHFFCEFYFSLRNSPFQLEFCNKSEWQNSPSMNVIFV